MRIYLGHHLLSSPILCYPNSLPRLTQAWWFHKNSTWISASPWRVTTGTIQFDVQVATDSTFIDTHNAQEELQDAYTDLFIRLSICLRCQQLRVWAPTTRERLKRKEYTRRRRRSRRYVDPFVRSVECAEFEHQQGSQPTLSHAVQKVEHEQSAHLLEELEILHCFLVPKLTADYQEGYRALLQSQYHKNSGAKMLAMICGTVALMSSSIRYQIWRPNSPAADTTFRIRMVRAHVPILIPIQTIFSV